ncbi:MAG: plastocyanin/azurin family copper-binding protein [Gaiellaceae bacterium]
MKPFAIVAAVAVLALPAATGAFAASAGSTLKGTVGPGFTITLTLDGKKVTHLKAGNYTVKIEDDSDQHDFHLSGPTVSKLTSISGKGTSTWHVTLKKGKYTYKCDPHSAFMKGSFTVG